MKTPETLQDYFDIAWNHAVVQKSPQATSEGGMCMYRTPDGCRCLIGAAIPDEKYTVEMDKGLALTRVLQLAELPIVGNASFDGPLANLQRCHDNSISTNGDLQFYLRRVEIALRDYAAFWSLEVPA